MDSPELRPDPQAMHRKPHTLLVARMAQSVEASTQPTKADAFVEFFDPLKSSPETTTTGSNTVSELEQRYRYRHPIGESNPEQRPRPRHPYPVEEEYIPAPHTVFVARMLQSVEASSQPSRADAFVEFFDSLKTSKTETEQPTNVSESERHRYPVEEYIPAPHEALVARMVESMEASKQPTRADAFVEFFTSERQRRAVEESILEPVAPPSLKPVVESNKPVETPIHKPVESNKSVAPPILKPVESNKPVAPPILKPVESNKPVASPNLQPVETPILKPMVESNKPVASPIIQPVKWSIHQPIDWPDLKPLRSPDLKPISTRNLEHVKTPVLKPVASDIVEPVEAPALTPIRTRVLNPLEAPILEHVETPVLKPGEASMLEHVETPVLKPSEASILKAVDAPVLKPVIAPNLKPPEARNLKHRHGDRALHDQYYESEPGAKLRHSDAVPGTATAIPDMTLQTSQRTQPKQYSLRRPLDPPYAPGADRTSSSRASSLPNVLPSSSTTNVRAHGMKDETAPFFSFPDYDHASQQQQQLGLSRDTTVHNDQPDPHARFWQQQQSNSPLAFKGDHQNLPQSISHPPSQHPSNPPPVSTAADTQRRTSAGFPQQPFNPSRANTTENNQHKPSVKFLQQQTDPSPAKGLGVDFQSSYTEQQPFHPSPANTTENNQHKPSVKFLQQQTDPSPAAKGLGVAFQSSSTEQQQQFNPSDNNQPKPSVHLQHQTDPSPAANGLDLQYTTDNNQHKPSVHFSQHQTDPSPAANGLDLQYITDNNQHKPSAQSLQQQTTASPHATAPLPPLQPITFNPPPSQPPHLTTPPPPAQTSSLTNDPALDPQTLLPFPLTSSRPAPKEEEGKKSATQGVMAGFAKVLTNPRGAVGESLNRVYNKE